MADEPASAPSAPALSNKRAMAGQPGESNKRASVEKADGWTCPKCNNHNYAHRQHCNMRTCGAPKPGTEGGGGGGGANGYTVAEQAVDRSAPVGSWLCPFCRNVNYPTRTSCNRRSCGKPRGGMANPMFQNSNPGLMQMQGMQAFGGPGGHMGMPDPRVLAESMYQPQVNANGAQGGAGAGGAAYGMGTPLTAGDASAWGAGQGGMGALGVLPGAMGGMGGAPNIWGGMGGMGMMCPPAQQQGNATSWQPGGQQAQQLAGYPAGSWLCFCGNVNYPTRTNCNRKTCLAPKGTTREGAGVGGAPAPGAAAQRREDPEGSWTCPKCQNVNWPQRTSCNKRSCGAARPEGV